MKPFKNVMSGTFFNRSKMQSSDTRSSADLQPGHRPPSELVQKISEHAADSDLEPDPVQEPEPEPELKRSGFSMTGNIEGVTDGEGSGWLLAPSEHILPMVLVDGQLALECQYPLPRPDVSRSIGISGDTGFRFKANNIREGSLIELCCLVDNHLVRVAEYTCDGGSMEENFIVQLDRALAIAADPNAVAITCWDGAHNPIGRAKVLYDVVSQHRPAVIISYLFEEFGYRVWEPLRSLDIPVLTIPRKQRQVCSHAVRESGLAFDTVWICKPRLPGFELAQLVSHEDTALILDFDDNEEVFSKSSGSERKPYGRISINMSGFLANRIESRTAASVSLAEHFDARMVRHAREVVVNDFVDELIDDAGEERVVTGVECFRIGFIGTVRPHKNLLAAARAIKAFNWTSDFKATFHVFGDVGPKSHAAELANNGAEIRQNVPLNKLNEQLAGFDVILTGFPSNDETERTITEFQITSKIGDALALGKPVLVPEGPSVRDLGEVPGVFLFNIENFADQLKAAIENRKEIRLPAAFSLAGAYNTFQTAENAARTAPRAGEVFSLLSGRLASTSQRKLKPTLVLLWKQNDAGFYGRRIDQIARSYRRACPDHRVIILELMQKRTLNHYEELADAYVSEHRFLVEQSPGKQRGNINRDGVELQQVFYDKNYEVREKFEQYLLEHSILPANTVFVLFPIIQQYKLIAASLRPYCSILDVVDNQSAWGAANSKYQRLVQYYALARHCDAIVFNSAANLAFFKDKHFLPEAAPARVIPNWYEFPDGYTPVDARGRTGKEKHVVYSGNMNDRIDWELMERIADSIPDIHIHLAGTASGSFDALGRLLENSNCIYHGPLSEVDTLRLLEKMDVAIMPHTVDSVSIYMNPLKVHMYHAMGLPTVASDVPGIVASETLHIADSRQAFVGMLEELLTLADRRDTGSLTEAMPLPSGAAEYLNIVEGLRKRTPVSADNHLVDREH